MLFRNLFAMNGIEVSAVQGIVISSVVPPLDSTLREVCERYFQFKPLFIEPGVKTGMPVHYDNPAEVGADRIVNSVAAFEKFGGPCIVVDFGTATTFDVVSPKGEYLGGVITPGIGISADALFERTARLPRVDIRKPPSVVATNTVNSLQAGSVLRLSRVDRRHPGAVDCGTRRRGEGGRHRRTGYAHGQRVEIYPRGGRPADAGRVADHIRTQSAAAGCGDCAQRRGEYQEKLGLHL